MKSSFFECEAQSALDNYRSALRSAFGIILKHIQKHLKLRLIAMHKMLQQKKFSFYQQKKLQRKEIFNKSSWGSFSKGVTSKFLKFCYSLNSCQNFNG